MNTSSIKMDIEVDNNIGPDPNINNKYGENLMNFVNDMPPVNN